MTLPLNIIAILNTHEIEFFVNSTNTF